MRQCLINPFQNVGGWRREGIADEAMFKFVGEGMHHDYHRRMRAFSHFLHASCCTALLFAASSSKAAPCTPSVVGDLRIQHFESATFHDTQTLRVWLPPGYDSAENAKSSYPVLYMLDGQNLFDTCTSSFGHEWKIDETLTQLIGAGKVEPLIVVGIDNAGARRSDEFIPFPDALFGGPAEPHGKLFPRFVVEEVKPLIEKQFRVKTGLENTGIGGSSYGSVAALYALMTRPDVFGVGLLESTSLQVGNGELLRMARSLFAGPKRVYVGVGEEEMGAKNEAYAQKVGVHAADFDAGFARMSAELANALKSAAVNTPQVLFVSTPGAHHEEAAWAARFPAAVTFLFPAKAQSNQ